MAGGGLSHIRKALARPLIFLYSEIAARVRCVLKSCRPIMKFFSVNVPFTC